MLPSAAPSTPPHRRSPYDQSELNLPYAACEILVGVCAVLGNGLVVLVFARDRKLRRRTNYYIISLASADLLVGLLGVPFAIMASVGLPTNLHACLFTTSVLVVLCTISIFCLVAVSIDRYWAILFPMGYSRTVRTKTAIGIICVCWVAGSLVGFLPLLGWNAGHKSDEKCIFTEVMDYDYLVFLYFATIIFPALLIAAFYAHIYRVVIKQLQQIVTMNPGKRKENQTHGTMLRLLGAAQKREVKATQNLSRIVAFFIVCWFPLYTINCVMAFCPDCEVSEFLLNFCIILSHLNSAGNPLLYAYHLKDFRAALKNFIHRMLFPGRAEAKDGPGMISVIQEPKGSIMGSQHRCSTRSHQAVGTQQPAALQGGNVNNRHASLMRHIHESRIREMQLKRTGSLKSPIGTPQPESNAVQVRGNGSRRGSATSSSSPKSRRNSLDDQTRQSIAVETTAEAVTTTMELRTYDFAATLPFVDCDAEDEEETVADVLTTTTTTTTTMVSKQQPDSQLVIEADVNQRSESARKTIGEDVVEEAIEEEK